MGNVVITGAAHGIGAALARHLAQAGHAVAVLDPDAATAKERAALLERGGASALGIRCDVTRPDACRAAVAQVTAAWGGIDILVNNAGATHVSRVGDTALAVIRRVVEVNVFGAVQPTQAALPSLLERKGQVVALSSVAGFAPLATRAGYAASQHAVEGFFGTLRTEYADDGLGVTVVRPSFVRTDIGARALGSDGGAAGARARSGVGHEIEPDAAAEEILRGVTERRRVVWVGRKARLASWTSHLLPRLYQRLGLRRTLD